MKPAYNRTSPQPNTTPLATPHNLQSGSVVAQSKTTEPPAAPPAIPAKSTHTLGRTHADYWKSRLFRRSYEQKGEQREVNDLYIRLQHGGRREFLPLGTTNKDTAAVKAKAMDRTLKESGWDTMLAKYYPDSECTPKLDLTVGDYLSAVRDLNCLKVRTYTNYANCLRTVVAEALGVKPDRGTSKFDYRSDDDGQSGNARWLAKIDGCRLEHLTPERVTDWKRQRIARAGNSPAAQASAKRTVGTYIRCSAALFSRRPNRKTDDPGILTQIEKQGKLVLPKVLPFDGVTPGKRGKQTYQSKVNARLLIAAARNDLKPRDPEAYKAFLLGMFAGLRRAEVDLLEWSMVDFANNVIHIEETEWLHLKSDDSAAEIIMDPEVSAELRGFMAGSTSPFVISSKVEWKIGKKLRTSTREPRNDSDRPYYRCKPVFDRLNRWLRGKGVKENKPMHTLRKEIGSIINKEQGIHAASKFLRHSDISTTARHYVDGKSRIIAGVGKYLNPATEPLTGQASAEASAPAAVAG